MFFSSPVIIVSYSLVSSVGGMARRFLSIAVILPFFGLGHKVAPNDNESTSYPVKNMVTGNVAFPVTMCYLSPKY